MKKLIDFLYIAWIGIWFLAVVVLGTIVVGLTIPIGC
jgi:hypothetical protein